MPKERAKEMTITFGGEKGYESNLRYRPRFNEDGTQSTVIPHFELTEEEHIELVEAGCFTLDYQRVFDSLPKNCYPHTVGLIFYTQNIERSITALLKDRANHFESCAALLRILLDCCKLMAYMSQNHTAIIPSSLTDYKKILKEGFRIVKTKYPDTHFGIFYKNLSEFVHVGIGARTTSMIIDTSTLPSKTVSKTYWSDSEFRTIDMQLQFLVGEVFSTFIREYISQRTQESNVTEGTSASKGSCDGSSKKTESNG